jgi:hypothetical protein
MGSRESRAINRRFTQIIADSDLFTAEAPFDGHRVVSMVEPQRSQRNQLAVSSWQLAAIRTTDYKTASSKKSTPPPGFLNSDLPTAYCYLPTSFPWRTLRLCGEILKRIFICVSLRESAVKLSVGPEP